MEDIGVAKKYTKEYRAEHEGGNRDGGDGRKNIDIAANIIEYGNRKVFIRVEASEDVKNEFKWIDA